ncbi:MAG: GNAT family N-acetyltransferase [Pseudorhodobacter sp.]
MTPETLHALMEASWPAAFIHRVGPWTIREGQGGGSRVSAATAATKWQPEDIALAEHAMEALFQPSLFMIREGESDLDQALEMRGYGIKDPVIAYAAPTADLADPVPSAMAAFPHWPPLAIARSLWSDAGIGPARQAVMDRTGGPKCALLGRQNDRASGSAFLALHGDAAMLHALEIIPGQRRRGAARNILRCAAGWARDQGAGQLAVVVTASNAPARALYASLGMAVVGGYHYRIREDRGQQA